MIATKNISMRFGQDTLFQSVSVKFRPEHRYGLIGANGSGKSTFMKVLTGELQPTTGEVMVDTGCSLGYLKQDHYEYEDREIFDIVYMGKPELWQCHREREELYSKTTLTGEEEERAGSIEQEFADLGGYTMEADAAKFLSSLGIEESFYTQTLAALTGGFKLRVLLAQVLFGKPDILLLDEPTNHLDMASREGLVNLLSRYDGTVIVISHDRHFLNSVCTHIADLDYQEMRLFTGNYDDFMIANEQALQRVHRENQKKEKRIAELKEFVNRFSANASKARQATSRQNELKRIEFEEIKPSSRMSPYIRLNAARRLGDRVIEAENITKAYDVSLFDGFNIEIRNAEKIAILGTNGIGKTTLLRTLIGDLEPDNGQVRFGDTVEISYFPQDTGGLRNLDLPAIEWLQRCAESAMTEAELRSFMGKMLFSGDDVNKPVKVLSGGEKSRLVIARMMIEMGNVLVLDEPTNHLDLEAIEALNYALTLVENTVIFASHDREFIRSLATRVIEITADGVVDYPGNLEDFEAERKRLRTYKRKENADA